MRVGASRRLGLMLLLACGPAAWAQAPSQEPAPARPAELLLPRFERFGIVTTEQLSRSLRASWPQTPTAEPELSRPHAWMLSAAQDDPGGLQVWSAMAKRDPGDLEAVYEAVRAAHSLHDYDAAERLLKAAEGQALILRDDRGGAWTLADLDHLHCLVIRDHRSAKEALPLCLRAAAKAVTAAPHLAVGRAQLLLGNVEASLPFFDLALDQLESPPADRAAAQFLRGVALQALRRTSEGAQAWAEALNEEPGFFPADRAIRGLDPGIAEQLRADAEYRVRRDAARLAGCGHLYLDLDLPRGAKRCFEASDRLQPGLADAERIAHQGEEDPPGALKHAEELLKRVRTVPVLNAAGWILHRQRRDVEARPYFDEVLRTEPRDLDALRGWAEICRAEGTPECGKEPIAERPMPTRREVDRTVLQLALSLVPLLVLFVLLRRRLRS